jgi:hypothetical protein
MRLAAARALVASTEPRASPTIVDSQPVGCASHVARAALVCVVAGAMLAVGCGPPPERSNDVYDCSVSSPVVGIVEPSMSLSYEVRCRALRTKVVLDDVAVQVVTDVAMATPDGLGEPNRAHAHGRAVPGSSRIEIEADGTWVFSGQVDAQPAFGNRSSAVPASTRIELVARPSFPDDPNITDEDRDRSPNRWKWWVSASSSPIGRLRR